MMIKNIVGISHINTYDATTLSLNNNNKQILVKDSNKNFNANDLLGIDSDGKITPIANVLGSLTVSNGLAKNTNDISIATDAVVDTPTFKLRNSDGHCDFTIQSGATDKESRLYFLNNNLEKARIVYANANNRLDIATLSGNINLTSHISTNGGTSALKLNNGNFQLGAGSTNNPLTNIITGNSTTVDIYKELDMNGNQITFKTNNTNNYIKYTGDSSTDGVEISGEGDSSKKVFKLVSQSGGGELLNAYDDSINIYKNTSFHNTDLTNVKHINGWKADLRTLNSATDQYLLKTSSVGVFNTGDILTVDSNNLLNSISKDSLCQEFTVNLGDGMNITKSVQQFLDGTSVTSFNLNNTISGIVSINGYNVFLNSLNNNNKQILVKDQNKNFKHNDLLGIDSSNKITPITPTDIISNISADKWTGKKW